MSPEVIYLLRRPDGTLWLEDIKSVFRDKDSADVTCAVMNDDEKREEDWKPEEEWTVVEFVSV